MNKLSNPSRNVSQYVYDFSRYTYSSSTAERQTIQKVKEITENKASDDGIKEIQLELLWKGLKSLSGAKKTSDSTVTNEQNKRALKKERKKKRKEQAALKQYRWDANDYDKKSPPAILPKSRKKKSKSRVNSSSKGGWSDAPSWAEVKARGASLTDDESKKDPVDRLVGEDNSNENTSVAEALAEWHDSEVVKNLLKRYQSHGFIFSLDSKIGGNIFLRLRSLVAPIRLVEIPQPDLTLTGKKTILEYYTGQLTQALNVFTFNGLYLNYSDQIKMIKPVLSFLWKTRAESFSSQINEYQIPSKVLLNSRFDSISRKKLVVLQSKWNTFDAIEKAQLIRVLRHKLGHDSNLCSIKDALVQPSIIEQFKREYKDNSNADGVQNQSAESTQKPTDNSAKPSANVVKGVASSKKVVFHWPSTIAEGADGSLPESQWPQVGMLKAVGYTVGQNGLALSVRTKLLTNVYVQELPKVDSQSYVDEWGAPESSRRLKKMAETLAALARNAKRKEANMSYAIRDWEHDLAWLKAQYYLKHKYTWSWPAVKNSDEATAKESSPKPEKVYKSSREFLVEQYTNSAGELCCQICQSALPFKLSNGEYYWEETRIDSSLSASPFVDIVLCPNHRAMYLHANSAPNLLLESLGDTFKNQISLKLASEAQSLFMSELHQEKLRSIVSNAKQDTVFDIEQIPKGLDGVKKLYVYPKGSDWVVSSRAKVIVLQPTRMDALQWINSFDNIRNVTSTVTEKVPTPKSKANKLRNTSARPRLSVAGVRFGSVKKSVPVSSHRTGYAICNTCNGDGGINGGCWKCGGSGWM
ncbi:hypothetical protein AB4565_06540 [Vibrio breoganii]